jgi:hypothetical protein
VPEKRRKAALMIQLQSAREPDSMGLGRDFVWLNTDVQNERSGWRYAPITVHVPRRVQ